MSVALFDRPSPILSADDIRRHSGKGSYPPICFDDTHFLISQRDFDALPDYSGSKPTGAFDGKCWKLLRAGEWFIGCFVEENPPHPDGLFTPYRRALIVEANP